MRPILCLLALLSATAALAHGEAQWIQEQGWKNRIGELCCGERDCAPLEDGDVAVTPRGYFIKSLNETVPFSEALPAPAEAGGRYWRCFWAGQRKCFFAPIGGS